MDPPQPQAPIAIGAQGGREGWYGWNFLANSVTDGIWACGPADTCGQSRTYDIYTTYFELTADQTVSGTPGTNLFGNTQTELFTGPWQVGDRIIGVGVQYMGDDVADTLYFNPDWEGDIFKASTAVGVKDGRTSRTTPRPPVCYYCPSVFTDASNVNGRPWTARDFNYYIPGTNEPPNPYFPFPSTTPTTRDKLSIVNRVYASGADTNSIKRIQFFYNLDAMSRLNEPPAEFISLTPQTKFVIQDTPSNYQVFGIDMALKVNALKYKCTVNKRDRTILYELA
jgi:hypothetical protein